jgi:hypothetical protein
VVSTCAVVDGLAPAEKRSRSSTEKWSRFPNLRRRPPRPAAGQGRLQRGVARAFLAAGTAEVSSSWIYDWALRTRRQRRSYLNRRRVWQLLIEIADPIERVPPHGAWLWRLRDSQSQIKK